MLEAWKLQFVIGMLGYNKEVSWYLMITFGIQVNLTV